MDVLARTKELLGSLADVTESGSKIARYKIEVANLDRKLGLTLRRVGERAWQLQAQGRTDVLGDADVQKAFEELRQLRARMEVIRQDVERNRARAADEARQAARIVQAGAGRASTVIREKGGRAVSAVRKAVAGKPASRRKAGKETSELQP
jgi:pyridoxal biosynthesis lyase PdxS